MSENPRPQGGSPREECSLYSRRAFLGGLGAMVTVAACQSQTITAFRATDASGAYAIPGAADSPFPTAPPGTIPSNGNVLVVVELGGGNDSLSTVVPSSGRYRDLRPTTAIENPIEIDSEIGLHPNLGNIAERYEAGTVAIVEGVGVDQPDLSHFVSMRRWWDGAEESDQTGWLGRYLDASVGYSHVLGGISVGPGPSPAMLGRSSYVIGVSDTAGLASGFPWWVDDARDFAGVWSGFAPAHIPIQELDPIRRAIAITADAQRSLRSSLQPLETALSQLEVNTYSLEGQLALAAGLIASGVEPSVIYVHGNTDFDTHEAQLSRHGELMGQLDRGVGHFFNILDEAGLADRALVMTTSEFGRRPQDNDGGTDHGTASSHFLIGNSIEGGRYGESPSLTLLDQDGNLKHTVDYRSMFSTVLDGWMGGGSEEVLRSDFEKLPVFRI